MGCCASGRISTTNDRSPHWSNSPVRASQIEHALKLPRMSVVRRLDDLIKHGYVERVGNAYRVTDKVNIPELQCKLQRRIDMVTETAKTLAELGGRTS